MPSASWYQRNKTKALEAHRKWREENREYDLQRKRDWYYKEGRKRDLAKKYGISEEEFNTILEHQENSCAICDTKENLCVDHNHKTGKVRGLLCYDCNRNFIGNNESSEKFRKAAEYLDHCWQDGKREKVT